MLMNYKLERGYRYMNKIDLLNIANLINENIEKYGLERYDLRDTRWIPFLLKKNHFNAIIRKLVLFIEEFCPVLLRKILGVKKKCWPTTYTFLGNAFYLAEKNKINIKTKYNSTTLMNLCLDQYVNSENQNEWWNEEPHIGIYNATIEVGDKRPTLLMHALTRCNIMLLELGKFYDNPKYMDIGIKSAQLVLKQYQIIDFEDGTKSISYFYNTYDCTININSEFAHWLSLIPLEKHTADTIDMFKSITRLLLKEQNEDGSWYYFSKWHMNNYSEKPSCDCHHTGTVLYNLINILKCDYLDEEIKNDILISVNNGMAYYTKTFFNLNSGKAITELGYKRPAGPVQYSEAIFAFCEFLMLKNQADESEWNKVKNLLPKAINQNISLINKQNGSAPSEKIIKWKNMNSIRWGNGPVLQSLISYLSIYDEIYLEK